MDYIAQSSIADGFSDALLNNRMKKNGIIRT